VYIGVPDSSKTQTSPSFNLDLNQTEYSSPDKDKHPYNSQSSAGRQATAGRYWDDFGIANVKLSEHDWPQKVSTSSSFSLVSEP
jgi:hypothetical protein